MRRLWRLIQNILYLIQSFIVNTMINNLWRTEGIYYCILSLRKKNTLTLPDLVELVGIEPTTPCVQSRCSPSWAIAPFYSSSFFNILRCDFNLIQSCIGNTFLHSLFVTPWLLKKYSTKTFQLFNHPSFFWHSSCDFTLAQSCICAYTLSLALITLRLSKKYSIKSLLN